jgi:molecular chaperone DnaK
LDRVVLVGGMTRMPAVRRLAREITGLDAYAHIDPDKVVALGAALQAGVLAGEVRNVTLVDVTPLSLGIETQGGLFARIIPRNTPIPATKSRLFTNARDDQTAVELHVLQGERELAADNMPLGRFDLGGITEQPRGEAKVEVVFDIDANGMIHVAATDLQTATSKRIRIEAAGAAAPEVVERMLAESRERVQADRRQREEIETAIRSENLIRAAGPLVEEAWQGTPTEAVERAAQRAEAAAAAARDGLAGGKGAEIAATRRALETALETLSAEIKAAKKPRAGCVIGAGKNNY